MRPVIELPLSASASENTPMARQMACRWYWGLAVRVQSRGSVRSHRLAIDSSSTALPRANAHLRGELVVPGDDDDADARSVAVLNGRSHLLVVVKWVGEWVGGWEAWAIW